MSQEETDLQKVLANLRIDYAKQLPQKLIDLTQATQSAIADPNTKDYARGLAHKLRGTAGSYGFHQLSEAAGTLEDLLRSLRFSPDEVSRALAACLAAGK
jgi:HPt (histidine-containing phosphotransfer) domain-containing protein